MTNCEFYHQFKENVNQQPMPVNDRKDKKKNLSEKVKKNPQTVPIKLKTWHKLKKRQHLCQKISKNFCT